MRTIRLPGSIRTKNAKQAHTAAQIQIDTAANKEDATTKQTDIIANKHDAAIKRFHTSAKNSHTPANKQHTVYTRDRHRRPKPLAQLKENILQRQKMLP